VNRTLVVVASVAVAALALGFLARSRNRTSRSLADRENVTGHLREMALNASADQIGISISEGEHGVWGVIADISMQGGSATVVAFADGTASMYWGTSGGIIGGQSHEKVRDSARTVVRAMDSCAAQMHPSGVHELPRPGYVRFYAHSRSGLLSSDELLADSLASGTGTMSGCFSAVNDLITELRQLSEAGV
jgi:hypothetical protein